MKRIEIVKLIHEVLFMQDRTNFYYSLNDKVYIKGSTVMTDFLNRGDVTTESSRKKSSVISGVLFGLKFYLYPDLRTEDPSQPKNKKKPVPLEINRYEFANRCVGVLMMLFDYNLTTLKIKSKDDVENKQKKIDRIFKIFSQLLWIFDDQTNRDIDDEVISKVFLKILESTGEALVNEGPDILRGDEIWLFNLYTYSLFKYFLKVGIPVYSESNNQDNIIRAVNAVEFNGNKGYRTIYKIYDLAAHIEQRRLDNVKEDLVNEIGIPSDNDIENFGDCLEWYMKYINNIEYYDLEMNNLDYLIAKIVLQYKYKKTKQKANDSLTEFELLVKTYNTLESKKSFFNLESSDHYNKFMCNLKFVIDYLKFHSSVIQQFTVSAFNPDALLNKTANEKYVTRLSEDEIDELMKKKDLINELYEKSKGHIPLNL